MLRLPKILSDGCVLQQSDECRIWGFCDPGQKVTAQIRKERETCGDCAGEAVDVRAEHMPCGVADEKGRFEILLETGQPGGPYELCVKCENGESKTLRGVYVGDVFVCAGQSNMELPMSRVRVLFPEEFQKGGDGRVHIYKVAEHYDFRECQEDHQSAAWSGCTRENLADASAFSYFFGQELAKEREVPVGIINLSLGGTPAQAWMSREGLADWPKQRELADIHKDDGYCRELLAEQERKENAWYREIERQEEKSADAPWKEADLPGALADWGLEKFCGCVYLRRSFETPKECAGRSALLRLGTLIDSDTVYINGVRVGDTPYRYPPRRYPIPEGLLRDGKNEIEIRLICREGDGRVTGNKPLDIIWEDVCSDAYIPRTADQEPLPEPIALSGKWEYQVRAVCHPAPEQIFINRVPTGLFQGMVAPCLPFKVRGVVWYQGESNDRSPQDYERLLAGLIRDWRNCWRQEKLPFVIVQLPNCDVDIAPGDAWAQIREAQRRVGRLEDTAVTVNLDLGEDNDLHPLDKKTAALRAAEAVRALVFGEKNIRSGPELAAWKAADGKMHLYFQGGDGRLRLKKCGARQSVKETPRLFELAGKDKVYYPARAKLLEGEIVLTSEKVPRPEYARYAWDRAPGALLLCDGSGRCASPFVTED